VTDLKGKRILVTGGAGFIGSAPHAVQSGDYLRDRNVGSRGFAPHTSLLQEYPSLCLKMARFHISQHADTASCR